MNASSDKIPCRPAGTSRAAITAPANRPVPRGAKTGNLCPCPAATGKPVNYVAGDLVNTKGHGSLPLLGLFVVKLGTRRPKPAFDPRERVAGQTCPRQRVLGRLSPAWRVVLWRPLGLLPRPQWSVDELAFFVG